MLSNMVKNTPHLIISTIIFFILPTNRLSLETTRMDFMNYKRSLDWRNFLEFGFGREVTVQEFPKFIEGTEELGKRKKG
ncbi:unnamed protein product [Rhizophagus irregularis]|nr:unnamed protein product [Rhizophagus irregularis]